jgi:hypothetical protein
VCAHNRPKPCHQPGYGLLHAQWHLSGRKPPGSETRKQGPQPNPACHRLASAGLEVGG